MFPSFLLATRTPITAGDRPILFVHTLDAGSHYLELSTFMSFTDDSGRRWSEPVSLPAELARLTGRPATAGEFG